MNYRWKLSFIHGQQKWPFSSSNYWNRLNLVPRPMWSTTLLSSSSSRSVFHSIRSWNTVSIHASWPQLPKDQIPPMHNTIMCTGTFRNLPISARAYISLEISIFYLWLQNQLHHSIVHESIGSWGRSGQGRRVETVFHYPRDWSADLDDDEDDSVALHVSLGTKLSRFWKFVDENVHFYCSGMKLSFHR